MCNVYIEIADHLDIKIFRITPKTEKQESKTTSTTSAPPSKEKIGVRTRSQVKKEN